MRALAPSRQGVVNVSDDTTKSEETEVDETEETDETAEKVPVRI